MAAVVLALVLSFLPPPLAPAARFDADIERIDLATAARMIDRSWHPGCPVGFADLRYLTVRYWGFDGRIHGGELVVHARVAGQVVGVFRKLFDARFAFRRMQLVDDYGGDDDASTRANNTSAFNCRPVTGGSSWSRHSYGTAIDINPVQNPYVYSDGSVLDPRAVPYLDRTRTDPGMIHDGDVVVRAFATIGWRWGGDFSHPDYQHFDR